MTKKKKTKCFRPLLIWPTNLLNERNVYIPVAYNHARTCLPSDAITSRQTGNRNKGAENDQPHHLFICVSLPTPFPVECREPGAITKGVVGRVHRDSSHVVVVVWNLLYSVYATILCGKAQAIWVTTVSRSQNDEDDEINSGNVSIVRKCLPLICEWIRQMEKKETEENEDNERRILSFFFYETKSRFPPARVYYLLLFLWSPF